MAQFEGISSLQFYLSFLLSKNVKRNDCEKKHVRSPALFLYTATKNWKIPQ